MKKKIKRVFSLLMILVMVGFIIMESETYSYADSKGLFSLEFYFGEDDSLYTEGDLSGIKVDVYASELTNYYEDSDMSEFTHSFAFSVYSDKNGNVSFAKPSEEFLIMVDESTLPRNTGVEIQTKFYRGESIQDRIEITEIDHVYVKFDETSEHGISVNAFNKAGKRINTFYTISEEKLSEDVRNLISGDDRSVKGIVYVGDKTIPYEYSINYSFEQRLDFIAKSIDNGSITKAEALQAYFDMYNEYGDDPDIYERVSSLKNDPDFYSSLSESQQRTINEILEEPSYNRTYTSGRFEIRYTSDSNTTPLFITSIMSALQAADTSLCSGLSLTQPRSNSSGTPKYYLYVLSEYNSSGGCVCTSESGIRVSYIKIYGITNLNNSTTDYQNGIVSHEYMHAIVHGYRNNSDLPKWFKDSWSEWAVTRVNGLSGSTCPATNVNAYLSNSYISFVSEYNVYGKLLYPLFIKQNYGGDTTVANVVKNLANTSDVYTAINNALSGTNTFNSVFPKFMRCVYKPKYLFTSYLSNWNDTAYLSADYGINNYPNNSSGGSINPYAAHYREFAVPSTTPYHLDITVNLSSNSSSFSGKLLMSSTSGVVTDWNFTTSGSLVTYSTNIGVSYSKGCVMFVNTYGPLTTSYTLTIARS